MPFDKCPKCGWFTVELDSRLRVVRCYHPECDYEKPVDIEEYNKSHDIVPSFQKTLDVYEYKRKFCVRMTSV